MLVTCAEMKALENAAFARGILAADLMDEAARGIADAVRQFFPAPGHVLAVCGKGNNAGDVLAAARHLAVAGWSVSCDLAFPAGDLTPLAASHLAALPENSHDFSATRPHVVLDGLLGIGATGAPREPIASAIRRINRLRETAGAFVVAADIPSGLDGDTGVPADPCVVADLTVTIGRAKIGLVADSATNFVGRIAVAPLRDLGSPESGTAHLATPSTVHLPPRPFDSHKGTWGRVGLIAGSSGFLGAARLCATAAIRAGGGLVTLYTKPATYQLLAATCPPEVMVRSVKNYADALADPLDALAVGPGLGSTHDDEILAVITQAARPIVIDADALNAIARNPSVLEQLSALRSHCLLTPHPGEMARLFPESKKFTRQETAEKFTATHPGVTLLLKGARTIIAQHGKPHVYNTTGHPGMGSGGMGDVLTGVCATFLAQGLCARDAATFGAWLCGRAAESAIFSPGGSPESLVASDVISHLGNAFTALRAGGF